MTELRIRAADLEDLEAIVRLFEADALGGHGDLWAPETRGRYEAAFAALRASALHELLMAEAAGEVVGTCQLILMPGISGRGALRAKLEGVQVRADRRSAGIGAQLVAVAEERARERGAASLALTSNKRRADAHRFYERLGYVRSHEGFKKAL